MLGGLTSAATETSEAGESATTAKYITEHGEYVVHAETTARESTESAHIRTVETKLIVLLAFLWVVENVVGFGGLFEFLLGLLAAWIPVWMVFDGYLAIGFLDLILAGILVYAQHLVVVSLVCHLFVRTSGA